MKRSWPISRYYSGTPLNGLKTRIKITVKTLALEQESNRAPSKYNRDQRPDIERAVTDSVT